MTLRWEAPLERPGVARAGRFFVLRFALDGQGNRRVQRTDFVHALRFVDERVPPGRYVYVVGALAVSGSGPGVEAELTVGA